MTVWPEGCGEQGLIRPQELKYRVRFENTGPGTAQNIYIRNPLPEGLDLSTFRILEASHNITRLLIEDGEAVIYFDEILLAGCPNYEDGECFPTSDVENKGYVLYTISPNEALNDGTVINNVAYIFFDDNPAVETNTIQNTLVDDPDVTADFSIFEVEEGVYNFVSNQQDSASYTHLWSFGDLTANPSGVVLSDDDRFVTHFISDNDGCSDFSTRTIDMIDPNTGFVTGGGWVESPEGAYQGDGDLSGKANFAFTFKYSDSGSVASGNTVFKFKPGNLHFKSASYDWMIVSDNCAKFKGHGTINQGSDDFVFMVWTCDNGESNDSSDTFRIKISKVEGGDLVYDTVSDNDSEEDYGIGIGGGNIHVHDKKVF